MAVMAAGQTWLVDFGSDKNITGRAPKKCWRWASNVVTFIRNHAGFGVLFLECTHVLALSDSDTCLNFLYSLLVVGIKLHRVMPWLLFWRFFSGVPNVAGHDSTRATVMMMLSFSSFALPASSHNNPPRTPPLPTFSLPKSCSCYQVLALFVFFFSPPLMSLFFAAVWVLTANVSSHLSIPFSILAVAHKGLNHLCMFNPSPPVLQPTHTQA